LKEDIIFFLETRVNNFNW